MWHIFQLTVAFCAMYGVTYAGLENGHATGIVGFLAALTATLLLNVVYLLWQAARRALTTTPPDPNPFAVPPTLPAIEHRASGMNHLL